MNRSYTPTKNFLLFFWYNIVVDPLERIIEKRGNFMMSKGKRILEVLTNENPDAIVYDGIEDALIGIYRNTTNGVAGSYEDAIAVYSYVKFIQVYIERDGMSEEEAVEFFDYNVEGLHLGNMQPIVIDDTGV